MSVQNGHATGFVEQPAHDWEAEKQEKTIYDDGTMTFFWRAHRVTVLVIFLLALVYVALFEEVSTDTDYNFKRGIGATLLVFILVGVTFMPDGPFIRPHPLLWRLTLVLQILYQLGLVFLLFQTVDDARQLMKKLDSELGKPLPEKSYGGNCLIYDEGNKEFPWHNLWDKMDGFVVVHFIGWWLKTLILRDWWLCMVISIMFEVLEYSFEHQLPNFSECWWDHWLMDFLICNGLGIYLGMKTLKYLDMKEYHWRGMRTYPTYRGKLKRIVLQFTPHSWTKFDWRPSTSFKRWIFILSAIFVILVVELNTFYLKWVLWLPPPHILCLSRLVLWIFWGAVGVREYFQYFDDPYCKKLGTHCWLCFSTFVIECLIVLKFDLPLVTTPLPAHISLFWIVFVAGIVGWTVWHFYLNEFFWQNKHKTTDRHVYSQDSIPRHKSNGKRIDDTIISNSRKKALRSRKT